MSFKVVGFIIDDNLYVPLNSNIYSIHSLNNLDIKSYIYLQDIVQPKLE